MSKSLFIRTIPSKVISLAKSHKALTLIITAAILTSIVVIGVTAADTSDAQVDTVSVAKPKGTGEVKSANDTNPDENADTTPAATTDPTKPSAANTNASTTTPKTANSPSTTTNKPANPSPTPAPSPTPSPNPTPTPSPTPNPNATFYLDLAPGSYKDKATNTLVQPYVITREPGHTASLTKSVTNGGVSCSLGSDNTIRMTFEPVMPANFYWCTLFVSDGKTTRSVDFAIHHSGGPTN